MADDDLLTPPEDELPEPIEEADYDEPPTAEEAEDLFDELEEREDEEAGEGEVVFVEEVDEPPLGRSWRFDFDEGRFVRPPGRGPAATHGEATLRQWVEKCLRTARGAHPVHSDDYGLDDPLDVIGEGLGYAARSDLAERLSDALTVHPRISAVSDFRAEPSGDEEEALSVSFVVETNQGDALPFENLELT